MGDKKIPKIVSYSSKNHLQLNRGWHKDTMSWLSHQVVEEEFTLENSDISKNIITSKFKEKLWWDEDKRKLRYYKDVINNE